MSLHSVDNHWFLADIFMKKNVVHILNSNSIAGSTVGRDTVVKEMVSFHMNT